MSGSHSCAAKAIHGDPSKTNQVIAVPDTAFLTNRESVCILLNRHIGEELFYLEQEVKLHQSEPVLKVAGRPLHFNIPVSQVAVLFRLFIESGLLKTQNQATFLKEVSLLIQTDHSYPISAASLRNKYYSPERSSLQHVKDILFTLIKTVQRLG